MLTTFIAVRRGRRVFKHKYFPQRGEVDPILILFAWKAPICLYSNSNCSMKTHNKCIITLLVRRNALNTHNRKSGSRLFFTMMKTLRSYKKNLRTSYNSSLEIRDRCIWKALIRYPHNLNVDCFHEAQKINDVYNLNTQKK